MLLVGVCGGVPHNGQDEIVLGDVVISKTVIQYDFGKQYPDKFVGKDKAGDNLSKHDKNIDNLMATFDTDLGRDELRQKDCLFLRQLQGKAGNRQVKYVYPGTAEDKLFESSYRHNTASRQLASTAIVIERWILCVIRLWTRPAMTWDVAKDT